LTAQNGLLVRDRGAFERARNLNAVLFDKTGTLTDGRFGVSEVVPLADISEDDVLAWAAALESQSQHPIAQGIVRGAEERGIKLKPVEAFQSLTEQGAQATIEGHSVHVVSPGYLREHVNLNTAPDALLEAVFASAGIDIGIAKSLVDRIADWRDSDHLRRLNGAEDSDYRAAGLPYGAKDLPFASVDELQMVLGVTPNIHSRLATALTVYADRRGVDLRVAPRPVLQALMDNNDARVNVFLDARQ
jgi:hypothetical protein